MEKYTGIYLLIAYPHHCVLTRISQTAINICIQGKWYTRYFAVINDALKGLQSHVFVDDYDETIV